MSAIDDIRVLHDLIDGVQPKTLSSDQQIALCQTALLELADRLQKLEEISTHQAPANPTALD